MLFLPFPAIQEVVPHKEEMVLLDQIIEHDSNGTVCTVTIGPHSIFQNSKGHVPAWVGIEYMAQCIAVFAGMRARSKDEKIQIGYLLGSRYLEIFDKDFIQGQTLEIRCKLIKEDNNIGVFQCEVFDAGNHALLLKGNLNVYRHN